MNRDSEKNVLQLVGYAVLVMVSSWLMGEFLYRFLEALWSLTGGK